MGMTRGEVSGLETSRWGLVCGSFVARGERSRVPLRLALRTDLEVEPGAGDPFGEVAGDQAGFAQLGHGEVGGEAVQMGG